MSTSKYTHSKQSTIAYCPHCTWFQDRHKIFKDNHKIKRPPAYCRVCSAYTVELTGNYVYEQVYTLFGMLPRKRVHSFKDNTHDRCGL